MSDSLEEIQIFESRSGRDCCPLLFTLSSLSLLPAPALHFFSPLLLYFLISRIFPLLLSTSPPALRFPSPALLSSHLASAVFHITMDSNPEPNLGLSPPAYKLATNEPTVEKIREMDSEELLKWVQQKEPMLLSAGFRTQCIHRNILDNAGDLKFFQEGCKLPIGPSDGLTKLASEVIGKDTTGTKSKSYLSCHARHADVQLATSQGRHQLTTLQRMKHSHLSRSFRRNSPPELASEGGSSGT